MVSFRGAAVTGGEITSIEYEIDGEVVRASFAATLTLAVGDRFEWFTRPDGKLVFKNLTSGVMAVAVMEEAE